jgi:hypothetical protein
VVIREGLTRLLVLLCVGVSATACGLVLKDPFARSGAVLPSGDMLPRAEALEDLDALMGILERVHPDPYRFRPREAVDVERRSVADTMPASISRGELCLRLSRVTAALDDGHTSISCDTLILRAWQQAAHAFPPQAQPARMFPPYMRLDDQQHLIVAWPNDAPGVQPGDRLLRVNGYDADALLAAWVPEVSHDTDAGRRAWIARRFRVQLAMHGIHAPYTLTVAAPGAGDRQVAVRGEPVNFLWQARPRPAPAPAIATIAARRPGAASAIPVAMPPALQSQAGGTSGELRTPFFTYRLREPGIAYMDFFSILDGLGTAERFPKAVDVLFDRIASDRPRVLIIDIRENGGGEDAVAGELLRHITEKPFRLLASTQVKRSEEARAFGKSVIRVPFRWMGLQYLASEGRQYFRGKVGTLSPPAERPVHAHTRSEPFFDGPVCVLTGPHTFSAAAEFAEAVKTYGLATIVGEETGGQPNSFGNPMPYSLPRSRLALEIATSRALRANGDASDFGSVKPDIVVRPTAADIRRGVDPVLERAKSCPERAIR